MSEGVGTVTPIDLAAAKVVKAARRLIDQSQFGQAAALLETLKPAEAVTLDILEADAIFARLPPIPWLIEALDLCPGAPAMLAGYGYTGKTIAAQSMALAIASGNRAWDAFAALAGRIVHFDYEQGKRLTSRRYQRLAAGRDLTPDDVRGNLGVICHPRVYLDTPDAEEIFPRTVDGSVLCIIDSLRAAAPSIDENSSEVRRVLDMLGRVSERTNCTFLVIHHARKTQKESTGGIRETIRGSGALYDACSSVLVLEGQPEQDVRTLHHVKARTSGKTSEPLTMRIRDVEVEGRGSGLVVTVESVPTLDRDTTDRQRRIAQTSRLTEELTRLFEAEPKQGGLKSIAGKLGRDQAAVSVALALLVDGGLVKADGSTRDRTHNWTGDV